MPENLLTADLVEQIRQLFDTQLISPVELILFLKNESCGSCVDTQRLLEEVSSISDKVSLTSYSLEINSELAKQFEINYAPGLVITGHEGANYIKHALRFAGIPSGYEFSSLIQGILLISKRDSGLSPQIRQELKNINQPVNLKVFVTPT